MGKVTLYKSADEWRWHRTSGGNVVADSGEGYVNKSDAEKQAKLVLEPGDTYEVVDGETSAQTSNPAGAPGVTPEP